MGPLVHGPGKAIGNLFEAGRPRQEAQDELGLSGRGIRLAAIINYTHQENTELDFKMQVSPGSEPNRRPATRSGRAHYDSRREWVGQRFSL